VKYFFYILFFISLIGRSENFPLDKITHATACYGIGLSTNIILKDKVKPKKLFTLTFAVPMTIGVGKEGVDYLQGKPFSLDDLKANFIGSITAAVFCQIVQNFKNKPKGQKFFFGTTDAERLERNKNKIDFSNL